LWLWGRVGERKEEGEDDGEEGGIVIMRGKKHVESKVNNVCGLR
jgi:hypothetical protein